MRSPLESALIMEKLDIVNPNAGKKKQISLERQKKRVTRKIYSLFSMMHQMIQSNTTKKSSSRKRQRSFQM